MADYVAGSLSALFGRKPSDDSTGGGSGSLVKLTHVKQMYEEFEPRKPPTVVGKRLDLKKDQQQQQQQTKRESAKQKSSCDASQAESKNERFVYRVSDAGGAEQLKRKVPQAAEDVPDIPAKPRKGMSNKEAALFRISKRKGTSDTIKEEDPDIQSPEKKRKHVKKTHEAADTDGDEDNDNDEEKIEEKNSQEESRRNFRYYEDDPTYIPQTIFVKNLPPKTQRKQMKKLFGNCGDILFVRFTNAIPAKSSIPVEAAIKKRSLIKEGTTICSFVVFADASSVPDALKLNGVELEGHHLRVDRREASAVPPKRSVFCGNIPFDTTDDELWAFFTEIGEIDYVRVVRDNLTGNGKGIAFVVFKESASALMALELSGKSFKSRTIRVTAIEKKRHSESTHGPVVTTSNTAQAIGGSRERINKKKMQKKSQQQERKQKGSKESVGKIGKQRREKLKKNIKREKASKFKKNFAKKLQGIN